METNLQVSMPAPGTATVVRDKQYDKTDSGFRRAIAMVSYLVWHFL